MCLHYRRDPPNAVSVFFCPTDVFRRQPPSGNRFPHQLVLRLLMSALPAVFLSIPLGIMPAIQPAG